jgi:hypothetical protein
MIIILNRLGIIGLIFAILPVFAGTTIPFLIAAIVSPPKTAPAPVSRTNPSPSAQRNQSAREAGARFGGIMCSLVMAALWHVAAFFTLRWVKSRHAGGASDGFWNATYGGAYALGIVFGVIALFTMNT